LDSSQCALAQAVVIGRLVQPDSDLATWRWLSSQTALPEMLAGSLDDVGKNAVYEMADLLLTHKDKLEQELRKRELTLFPSGSMLFLFDLTNTYFEGQCANNSKAEFGHSKEKRSNCRLVTLALVVDSRGFPVFSQVYGGDQSEPQTLEDVLTRLEKQMVLFPECRPTIVMDRGIATNDNMSFLKVRQFSYIVIERRPVEKGYVLEFEKYRDTFEEITTNSGAAHNHSNVFVKKVPMDVLMERRFLEDVDKLRRSIQKGTILLVDKISQRVGRIKERYPSISRYYEIDLSLAQDEKKVATIHCRK
jgi:hypothetical protein